MSDRESLLHALLAVMEMSDVPLGTREARRALEAKGVELSESTISRLLRELDARGWSTSLGRKGRLISDEGRHQVREAEKTVHAPDLGRLVDVKDVRDLIDLLYARRAVESAAAADAALSATEDDVDKLQELMRIHEQAMGTSAMDEQPGLSLHRQVASLAKNQMLQNLAGVVLAPRLDRVESVLDIILGSNDTHSSVLAEHQRIVDAVARQDPGAAEAAVREHFDGMIVKAKRFIEGENASVARRLLQWMESSVERPAAAR